MLNRNVLVTIALAASLGACGSTPHAAEVRDESPPAVVLPASVADDWRGKVVVADFWATWCQPCRASSPNVQILHDQFSGDPGVLVVGVHADDGNGDPESYVAENGYTYPMVLKGQAVADAFEVNALPTFVVIDDKGREVHRHVGMMTLRAREQIAAKVRELRG